MNATTRTSAAIETIRHLRRQSPTVRANRAIYLGFRRQGIAPAPALANTLALS